MSERNGNDVAVLVRLSRQLRDELAAQAAEEDRSVASLLRVAAREYLRRVRGEES
jgi:hypothetical protein